jgi:hypothetical protein
MDEERDSSGGIFVLSHCDRMPDAPCDRSRLSWGVTFRDSRREWTLWLMKLDPDRAQSYAFGEIRKRGGCVMYR